MNKEQLWKIYIEKNPVFLKGSINFTPEGLKKFFDQTFEQGFKEGKSIANYSGYNNTNTTSDKSMPDLMKDILSGKGFGK